MNIPQYLIDAGIKFVPLGDFFAYDPKLAQSYQPMQIMGRKMTRKGGRKPWRSREPVR